MKPKFEKLIIDIKVADLDRAVKFYRDILSLPFIDKAGDWAAFEAAGAEIHLYLHGGATQGVEFRVADIEKSVAALKQKGLEFFLSENQKDVVEILNDEIMVCPWGKIAFFKDSEGNQLALVEDQ